MPPSIHRSSSINSTPAACGARRSSGPGGGLSADIARVASARRHTMPEIGARRGADGDRAAPALRESFRLRLDTVSSRAATPPEADPRATAATDGTGATGTAGGPSHGATSLDAARACLAELAGDRRGALTTLVAQLNGHDRRALDHLALTVHALHLTVDDASHAKAFAGIGDALASFLAAAARSNAKPGSTPRDLCVEGNKDYRTLCERVGGLLRTDGIADAMFGRARERGDAAADALVSERLGGRMDGHVRTNGMVNRHGGDAQLRMADAAQRFALGARHATNLVDMVGTALELLGRTDQLLNDVSLKRPAADPGGPRAPGGEPAGPAGPASGAAQQPAAPVVVNNHNENNVNVNLDGLEKLVGDLGKMMGALLERMGAHDPSHAQPAARDANGRVHVRTGGHATVVKSPVSVARTSNGGAPGSPAADGTRGDAPMPPMPPASPAGGPSVDGRTPATNTVERSAGNGGASPTGAWRRADDGGWRMARGNPVVRTTEGATRIDPFSRVGARPASGAGATGARRDAAGAATQRSAVSETGGGAADATALRGGGGAVPGGVAGRVERRIPDVRAGGPERDAPGERAAGPNGSNGRSVGQPMAGHAPAGGSDAVDSADASGGGTGERATGMPPATGSWSRDPASGGWVRAGGAAPLRSTEGFGRLDPFAGAQRHAFAPGASAVSSPSIARASMSAGSTSASPAVSSVASPNTSGIAPPVASGGALNVASGVTSNVTSGVAPDSAAWPRPSALAPRNIDPRRMNRAQLERAGLYPLVDDDASSPSPSPSPSPSSPSSQSAPADAVDAADAADAGDAVDAGDAAARRASWPDAGAPKPGAAKTFPSVAPAARIVTTEGATRVGWNDSIAKGTKR
ncbi:hypothetical protein BTRA_3626 [Burkholderia thailandensis USAMRU Malaysia |uniref:hypothetical protein n=1 Tax=Burkholderia thailandensis TaxID=57975 RepID=UPI000499CE42|nr:hypothetical protein [Burkholderia thailandensis]AIC90498.1 hypothetical protein BTRA_3626 [Burkholderia thailandensis USAMRU Malaysia \